MVRNDSDALALTGNDRFHGFSVDVLRALSAMLKFRYELYVVGDEQSTRKGTSVSDKVVQELTEGVSMCIFVILLFAATILIGELGCTIQYDTEIALKN